MGVAPSVTHLPAPGGHHRNPNFWGDLDVRELVIATHRQMTGKDAIIHIRERVGPARTPSHSALSRAWKRLDPLAALGVMGGSVLPVPCELPSGIVHRDPFFWRDAPVRDAVVSLHRQVTLAEARQRISAAFGAERTPSKSALCRAWKF